MVAASVETFSFRFPDHTSDEGVAPEFIKNLMVSAAVKYTSDDPSKLDFLFFKYAKGLKVV